MKDTHALVTDSLSECSSRAWRKTVGRTCIWAVLLLSVVAVLAGLPGKAFAEARVWADGFGRGSAGALTASKLAAYAGQLRAAYRERDATRYRLQAFESLVTVRRATTDELETGLTAVASHIRSNGADGVEPLLLALADGLATRASPQARIRAGTTLRELAPAFRYHDNVPAPNLKIPLARGGGYLTLDVAPRIARLIAGHGLLPKQPGGDARSLLEILEDPRLRGDICNLPLEPDQNGALPLDEMERQNNCADHGFAGRPGGGTAGEALGRMLASGCNLSAPDDLAAEKERLAAIDQCMKERRGGGGIGPDVADGGILEGILIGVVAGLIVLAYDKIFDVEYDAYRDAAQADAKYAEEFKEYQEALDDYAQAVDELGDAVAEEASAEQALNEANTELEQAQAAAEDAAINGTDEELQAAEEALDEAKKTQEEAQKRYDQAKANREQKEKEVKEKREKAAKEGEEAEEVRPKELPAEDAFNSPACRKAMGDPTDRLLQEKLGADWTDWRTRLNRVSYPPPDDVGPYEALNVPVCGVDGPTVHSGSAACKMPVHCPEGQPDAQCGCGGAEPASSIAVARMLGGACAEVTCEDGSAPAVSPRGIVCECSRPEGEEDGDLPVPQPVVDALFGTSDQAVNQNPTVQVLRSLFDGQSHMPPNGR